MWGICVLFSALWQLKNLKFYFDGLSDEHRYPELRSTTASLDLHAVFVKGLSFGDSRARESGVIAVSRQPPGLPRLHAKQRPLMASFPRAVGRKSTLTSSQIKEK